MHPRGGKKRGAADKREASPTRAHCRGIPTFPSHQLCCTLGTLLQETIDDAQLTAEPPGHRDLGAVGRARVPPTRSMSSASSRGLHVGMSPFRACGRPEMR
jgi:hypothetical protein